ncbi:MAG: tRNA (adenosine(37)-N6)-dimethylallyltransferase MiaA [Immundisolibacteraceae bacterium]|nr:tRNA (adenosine(37)-N6)-dimethylallyltransferase MiaA [Immundisolibacteraceae bacterium]
MTIPPVIVITGPTAGGKTALALALADRFPCQLISVDSSLVYRQMNIGTAKPDAATLKQYPHALVDIRSFDQPYSAGEFVADATAAIAAAIADRKIPVLVGGTLLYLRALFQGMAAMPAANPQIRLELEAEAASGGWSTLHDELTRIDPLAAARIARPDRQRIQRALEVYRLSGKPITEWQRSTESHSLQRPSLKLILMPPERQVLHQKIAQRSSEMIAAGLISEVEKLRAGGISAEQLDQLPAMRAVGYRQVIDFLLGRMEQSELLERITIATRQLAKRQLTWLRSDPGGTWFDPDAGSTVSRASRLVAKATEGAC